jgi:hypothetical protein
MSSECPNSASPGELGGGQAETYRMGQAERPSVSVHGLAGRIECQVPICSSKTRTIAASGQLRLAPRTRRRTGLSLPRSGRSLPMQLTASMPSLKTPRTETHPQGEKSHIQPGCGCMRGCQATRPADATARYPRLGRAWAEGEGEMTETGRFAARPWSPADDEGLRFLLPKHQSCISGWGNIQGDISRNFDGDR